MMVKHEVPESVSKTELCNLIDEYIIGWNAERNRRILKRRLIDGILYEKLSEEFGLSVRRTKDIVYKCEDKLFRHIK